MSFFGGTSVSTSSTPATSSTFTPQKQATPSLFGTNPTSTTPSTLFGMPAPTIKSPFGSLPQQSQTPATSGGASIFGATAGATPASTGMFGGPSANTPAAGGVLGGTPTTTPASRGWFAGAVATSSPASRPLFGAPAATMPTSGGMFGGTATTPASGGLFGNAATTRPASAGAFGGAATTTVAPASAGIFGGATPTPAAGVLLGGTATTAPATGGIFGGTAPTTPTTGGLLGGTATTTAPATRGLFGNTTTTAPVTGGAFGGATATAPVTGGIFGGTTTTTAPASGGIFGGSATPFGTTPGGGIFGSKTTTPATTQPAGGLPGTATATTPAVGGGLFGTGAAQQSQKPLFPSTPAITLPPDVTKPATKPGGIFGGSNTGGACIGGSSPGGIHWGGNTGAPQQLQQSSIPAATVDASRLMPTTRFGDCHPEVQAVLTAIEQGIQEQMRIATELRTRFTEHGKTVNSIPSDTFVLSHKLTSTKSFLTADEAALNVAKQNHAKGDQAATLCIRNVDLFRLSPSQRGQYVASHHHHLHLQQMREVDITSNKPMIDYFNAHIKTMENKLRVFMGTVKEVELSLRSIEEQAAAMAAADSNGTGFRPGGRDLTVLTGGVDGRQDARRLNRTLREFNDALKQVSGRIVDVKDAIRDLTAKR